MTADSVTPQPPKDGFSPWYAQAMHHLVEVVQVLSQAHDLAAIAAVVRSAARRLTGADGATFVLRDAGNCHYFDEDAIAPLWKGKRFPMEACISGWVMMNAQAVMIPDIYADARIPAEAYRPTFVRSLAMVPVRSAAPIAAIGVYWAHEREATAEEMAVLQALADTTSVAMENARLFGELSGQVELLQSQQARISAQHESLEVFARALAHDLKEPVRTVRAFSDLIAESDDDAETKAAFLDLVRKAADRMAMLVDTVFAFTQLDDPERFRRLPVDMDQVTAGAIGNLDRLIRERAAVVTADPLPEVEGQAAHLMQVMQNLIANALRHGGDGVKVHVACEADGDMWRFSVSDNGPGVEPGDAERIFKPFKRLNLNDEGAGLGLATCRKVVALHGGRIWYEDAEGGGARFCFTVPMSEARRVPEPVAAPAEAPSARRPLAHVLLVDDREADIELTRVLLQVRDRMEFRLTVARGGREGLDLLRQAENDGNPIDLLLLDINMPGMDGFEMLEVLRADSGLKDTAVVMCTGSTYDKDMARAEALGAAGYMVKPPSLAQLKPMLAAMPALHFQGEGAGGRLLRAA